MQYNDWIPISSEHYPKTGEKVIITYKSIHIVEKQVDAVYFLGTDSNNIPIWQLADGSRCNGRDNIKILAWQPLPKAF